MKAFVALFGLFFAIVLGVAEYRASFEYSNTIGSYWHLSDKASTLQQKSLYLDQFVTALEHARLAPYNATIYQTPNNSLEQNMVALKSLQGRMHQIQGMDETSFAYQTAIQQITAQEQGEARELTSTFEGCWFLENWTLLWGWHAALAWLFLVLIPLGGAGLVAMADSY